MVCSIFARASTSVGSESRSGGRIVTNKFYLTSVMHVVDTVARITGMPATRGVTLATKF